MNKFATLRGVMLAVLLIPGFAGATLAHGPGAGQDNRESADTNCPGCGMGMMGPQYRSQGYGPHGYGHHGYGDRSRMGPDTMAPGAMGRGRADGYYDRPFAKDLTVGDVRHMMTGDR